MSNDEFSDWQQKTGNDVMEKAAIESAYYQNLRLSLGQDGSRGRNGCACGLDYATFGKLVLSTGL